MLSKRYVRQNELKSIKSYPSTSETFHRIIPLLIGKKIISLLYLETEVNRYSIILKGNQLNSQIH